MAATGTRAIAEAVGLRKVYHRGAEVIEALAGLDLALEPGTFSCVLGPSGAGKTTLFNLLGVMDVPTAGTLRVAGETIVADGKVRLSEGRRDRLRRENIGFIFTEFFLMPTLSAVENVQMPLLWSGERRGEEAKRRRGGTAGDESGWSRAVELLSRVGLANRLHHRPGELSGGEMQRVAIARALINHPVLLLADEPTGNVDTKTRDGIFELFRELNADGLTIVLATHDHELARRMDRVVPLQGGRIVHG